MMRALGFLPRRGKARVRPAPHPAASFSPWPDRAPPSPDTATEYLHSFAPPITYLTLRSMASNTIFIEDIHTVAARSSPACSRIVSSAQRGPHLILIGRPRSTRPRSARRLARWFRTSAASHLRGLIHANDHPEGGSRHEGGKCSPTASLMPKNDYADFLDFAGSSCLSMAFSTEGFIAVHGGSQRTSLCQLQPADILTGGHQPQAFLEGRPRSGLVLWSSVINGTTSGASRSSTKVVSTRHRYRLRLWRLADRAFHSCRSGLADSAPGLHGLTPISSRAAESQDASGR